MTVTSEAKLDERSFLAIAAGRYGRDLLSKYRNKLLYLDPVHRDQLPTRDTLTEHAKKLFRRLVSGHHSFATPINYIVIDKHSGVPRVLPVFHFDDALIYYFCVFSLQDDLAEGRVEGTFGGWQLSNAIRRSEQPSEAPHQEGDISYIPYLSVNRIGWSKHWMDFQREAYAASQDGANPFIVKYDVANFYDSINLDVLERRLRQRCSSVDIQIIDILMLFLRFWNRSVEGYAAKQTGIPMDVEGDASRLLANFYLQEHDAALSEFITSNFGGRFLRFSDDMLVLAPCKQDRGRGLLRSALELHRIGLSINGGKVVSFDGFEDYDYYWAFDLFETIGDGKDFAAVNSAVDTFFDRLVAQDSRPWRLDSVLKRLLRVNHTQFSGDNRARVTRFASSRRMLLNMEVRHLRQIYNLLEKEERSLFVSNLYQWSSESLYTQQLYNVRDFIGSLRPPGNISLINSRIRELVEFYDLSTVAPDS